MSEVHVDDWVVGGRAATHNHTNLFEKKVVWWHYNMSIKYKIKNVLVPNINKAADRIKRLQSTNV